MISSLLSALCALCVRVFSPFYLATIHASLPSSSTFSQHLGVIFFFLSLLTVTYSPLTGLRL
jgi:hypothetical protein